DAAGNWGATASKAFTKDTTAPSSVITFPTDGSTYTAGAWATGCAPNAGVCGTASDPGASASGVQKVEVSIKRNSDGVYWNGSAFSGTTEAFNAATGTTSWTYAFSLPADGSY